MHHSITPPLHYSSLWYVGTRRLSTTKHMSLFSRLLMDYLIALRQDVEITVRPTRKEHGRVSIILT